VLFAGRKPERLAAYGDADAGVVIRTAMTEVRVEEGLGTGSPMVVFPAGGERFPLVEPEVVERDGSALHLTYRMRTPSGVELSVRRHLSLCEHGDQVEWVETMDIVPSRPLTVDVEIRRPFSIRSRGGFPGGSGERSTGSATAKASVVWPLRNGWAREVPLADAPQSAEYRLAETLSGRETPELALPVADVCIAGVGRAAVCTDPRFSSLFALRQSARGVEGEIRYRYRGGRVPLKGTESRRFGMWLGPAAAAGEPFGKSMDAFFRLMLPDVPPGPAWLHQIAMVGYDYLSDGGQGWQRDVERLAGWLTPAERSRVALCFHGWYDGIGSYAFDETTGRMKDRWVAMPKTRKVAFAKNQVRELLGRTRALGFRVLWYFGDGVCQDRGGPCYRAEWNLLDEKGQSPRATWSGPDTFDRNFIRNPAHPAVARWYQSYLAALLADYGPVVDGFVWDETYYIRRGDVGRSPEPAYCDRAMLDLVGALRKQVKACDRRKVFLASDDIGVFGMDDAIGYAMVADGNYQDSWCVPEAWSYALFPNWRNTSWSCNWWPQTHFARTRWGVENFAAPVAISNGWEDDRGPSEWTAEERDRLLGLFRKRMAMSDRVRFLRDDPAKLLATAPGVLPQGDTLPEPDSDGVNWALAKNGGRASASSEHASAAGKWSASGVIDGIRDDTEWSVGHGWASQSAVPQWIQIDLAKPRDIATFAVVTYQAKAGTETAAKWGVKDYTIEVWDAAARQWKKVVEENRGRTMKNRVHRLAQPIRVEKFRVVVSQSASGDGIARLLQVEAWGLPAANGAAKD
jgi:hypothetical protein